MHNAGCDQNGERGGAGHLNVLRYQENSPALDAIGDHAANQRKQKNGNAAQKLIESQQKRRMAQTIDQPALGHDLHPGTDAGGTGANPHQPKIAVLECLKKLANARSLQLTRIRTGNFCVGGGGHPVFPANQTTLSAAMNQDAEARAEVANGNECLHFRCCEQAGGWCSKRGGKLELCELGGRHLCL